MNALPDNYAKVLYSMGASMEDVAETRELLECPELLQALGSPFVARAEKRNVIDILFPAATKNFVKVMSDNEDIAQAGAVFAAYDALLMEKNNSCKAVFTYVTKPDDEQIEKLKKVICKQYGKSSVELTLREDPSLVGGFVLSVNDYVLDKSLRAAMLRMQRHFAAR